MEALLNTERDTTRKLQLHADQLEAAARDTTRTLTALSAHEKELTEKCRDKVVLS